MRRDSKIFSDIMDIDTTRMLYLMIDVRTYGEPEYQLTINGEVLKGVCYARYLDLLEPIDVRLTKSIGGTVTIERLSINGQSVLPLYSHMTSNQRHWITEETTWHLSIPSPFHLWYHEVSGQGWIA